MDDEWKANCGLDFSDEDCSGDVGLDQGSQASYGDTGRQGGTRSDIPRPVVSNKRRAGDDISPQDRGLEPCAQKKQKLPHQRSLARLDRSPSRSGVLSYQRDRSDLPTRGGFFDQGPVYDANWVHGRVKETEENLRNAASALCQQLRIAENAAVEFVHDPKPALDMLYETVFGKERWQLYLSQLLGNPAAPRQDNMLMALFGASIFQSLLAKDLPWDLKGEAHQYLGANQKYLALVLADHDLDLDKMLKYAANKQIADQDFQAVQVAEHSRKLTDLLVSAIQPHLDLSTKKKPASERETVYDPWHSYLERAFHSAIVWKQTTATSKLGPYKFSWPRSGRPFNKEQHRRLFDLKEPSIVLHPVLPGVFRFRGEKRISFSKALVVLGAKAGTSLPRSSGGPSC